MDLRLSAFSRVTKGPSWPVNYDNSIINNLYILLKTLGAVYCNQQLSKSDCVVACSVTALRNGKKKNIYYHYSVRQKEGKEWENIQTNDGQCSDASGAVVPDKQSYCINTWWVCSILYKSGPRTGPQRVPWYKKRPVLDCVGGCPEGACPVGACPRGVCPGGVCPVWRCIQRVCVCGRGQG